ncbi:arsenic resistance N-acetyltransferase ArsN2 [Sorangium sp. So ce1504]|uniref:arsenic resistance N-acetyltransferase ArsN2 n=1 Tax=Sorangium sp. So ce1504 TaxID=3133337 RepID=UPI003F644E26
MSDAKIEPAASGDLDVVRGLLVRAELPTAGLLDQFPAAYVVIRRSLGLVGVAGLETYGRVGLLRSVAVARTLHGQGFGRALVANRIDAARVESLEAVYLLTTTAADYFRALGFASTPREVVPADLAASPEFAGACPASAACLVLRL